MQETDKLVSYKAVKHAFNGNISITITTPKGKGRAAEKAIRGPITEYIQEVWAKIDALPGVEIVRCKDCKNVARIEHDGTLEYWCDIVDGFVTSDDYCSWGKPKEEING